MSTNTCDRRWTTLAPLVVLITAIVLSARPIDDVDIFWQIRIGQLIRAHGFNLTEQLCYRHLGEPMTWVGWLGQVIFASIHRVAGWEGVQALHVLVYTAAIALVFRRMQVAGASVRAALLALAMTVAACLSNCSERPQTFAFCAFAALLLAGEANWPARRYWGLAVPLLLLWQNTHPSVTLAVAVWGLQAVGGYVDSVASRRPPGGCESRRPSWKPWKRPLATAAVAACAVFCTPAGPGILSISSRNAQIARWLGIGEWQPAYVMFAATLGFWMMLLAMCVLWLWGRPRLAWREILPALLLTAAALSCARLVVFWALLCAPTLARLLDSVLIPCLRSPKPDVLRAQHRGAVSPAAMSRPATWCCRMASATALALLVMASPWVRPTLRWLPESRRCLLDPQFPTAGLRHLLGAVGAGRIYNYREWGGLISFLGAPYWQVAIDGRIYRHDRATWQSYAAVALGHDEYLRVFERDRPTALFLHPQHDSRLIERVRLDSDWYDLYRDANCHIFISRRNAPLTADAGPVNRSQS